MQRMISLAGALACLAACRPSPSKLAPTTERLQVPRASPSVRPLGVNLPFLAAYYFNDPPLGPAEARRQLALTTHSGFQHARFFASQYWPSQMTNPQNGWLTNRAAYFARFDELMRDAAHAGVKLIPSFVQNSYLFPDLAGEPRSRLFVPGSRTRQLLERYIRDFVLRYRSDPTVLFWEIGNELNLDADIPAKCTACRCDVPPAKVTMCDRTGRDEYRSCNACDGVSLPEEDLGQLLADLAQLIHQLDPTRSISSGNSVLRPSAYHLASRQRAHGWRGYADVSDAEPQYTEMLRHLDPSPIDLVSLHDDPADPTKNTDLARFGGDDVSGGPLIARTEAWAASVGKKLYVGEFGEINGGTFTCNGSTSACGGDPSKQTTRRMIDAMVTADVAYGSLYAFESSLDRECPGVPGCYDVLHTDPIVPFMAYRNTAFGACVGRPAGSPCPGGKCGSNRCILEPTTPLTGKSYLMRRWTFAAPSALAGWNAVTNCANCGQGVFAWSPPGFAHAAGPATLPNSTTAGLYVSSGSFDVKPGGRVTLRFHGRTNGALTAVALVLTDAGGNTVALVAAAPPIGTTFGPGGTTWLAPPGAHHGYVQIQIHQPTATLDLTDAEVVERL